MHTSLRPFLTPLLQAVTQPGAPFHVFTGEAPLMHEHGVQYYLADRARVEAPALWFERTAWAQRRRFAAERARQDVPRFHDRRVMLLIRWPNLLWQARFKAIHGHSPLRRAAFNLLVVAAELVEQYDSILAGDLRRFTARSRANPLPAEQRPLDYGQLDVQDEQRFDEHLRTLLKSKSFLRHFANGMEAALHRETAKRERTKVGACPAGTKHRKGQRSSCDACAPVRWAREHTLLLDYERVANPDIRDVVQFKPEMPGLYRGTQDVWNAELRYWVDGISPQDGACRIDTSHAYGDYVLVNYARLIERARVEGRASPLLGYYNSGATDLWLAGSRAREAVQERLGAGALGKRRRSLKDYVEEAGWTWKESLDIPYEVYSATQLIHRLSNAARSASHLLLVSPTAQARRRVSASARELKVGYLNYLDEAGQAHRIQVIRRSRVYGKAPIPVTGREVRTLYTTPYDVAGELMLKGRYRPYGTILRGTAFWTLHGVNKHANMKRGDGTPVHSRAEHFARWLEQIDSNMDRTEFRRLRYETKYADRLAKKQRGESVHVGAFMRWEDETIRAFFEGRTERKRVQSWEWNNLLGQLPGRNRRGVQRRLLEMGHEYAQKHGWAAYASSPLCLKNTAKRRAQWTGRTGKRRVSI